MQTDFIILPCDFVPPPTLPLSSLLDKFRMDTDGLILASLFYEVSSSSTALPDEAREQPPVVLYDPASETLLQIDADGEDDGGWGVVKSRGKPSEHSSSRCSGIGGR